MPETLEATEKALDKGHPGVTRLAVSGMTCGNCARHVTQAIQSVPGVRNVQVSLDAHQATISWKDQGAGQLGAVIKAIEEEGYGAKVAAEAAEGGSADLLGGWRINVLLGVPVTVLLMVGEWVLGLGMTAWFRWLAFGLASLVQVFAGGRFYRGAWSQLKAGNSNMDTLVALGSTTAFAFSAWALLSGHPGHLYFMEAAAIITLISVGHWVESRVTANASSTLRSLFQLAPQMARRRNTDGSESEVPVAELEAGDTVLLRPGDRVPVDGAVLQGNSAVDESMLTGESVPAEKTVNQPLYAGTVNLNGLITMRVTATGEETALSQVIAAVQRAQNSRAGIQRIGDRVSSVFVPVVVAIALGAALWWGLLPHSAMAVHQWLAQFLTFSHLPENPVATAFIIAAAVLIIACPCAMGLATPAAIMAGSNAAARRGILIRDAVALEKAGSITAVLFDKTGTLTVGRPNVVAIWDRSNRVTELHVGAAVPQPGGEDATLSLAAALARHSSHPISQAIARTWSAEREFDNWQEVHGAGLQAEVRFAKPDADAALAPAQTSQAARLGSVKWLGGCGVSVGPGAEFVRQWSGRGATVIGLAVGMELMNLFALRDTLKPGASRVVASLHGQSIRTYLVTGDNALTAAALAGEAGIPAENVFAEVRPERKAEFVKRLQEKGERVAFVGDGINDAPALEQADLGIAVSKASDIAREAADIILLKSEIEAVPESLGLARATLRTIKQNLFWAFFYNAAGIPLAALGFMSPILCAAAMGLSDLVVIGNALRLLRWKMPAASR